MVSPAEAGTDREAEARREMGRRVYDATTEIVGNLLATPEFMSALGTTFFGRSFPNGGRATIADGVFFRKGEFDYNVSYRAEPLVNGRANQSASVQVNVNKYNPNMNDPLGQMGMRVGSARLLSQFTEDREREVVSFNAGYAFVNYGELNYEGLAAFNRLHLVTGIFSPKPVKL